VIVADANLLVYLFVRGQRTAAAEAVFAREPAWAAPLLWRSEFRNAMIGLVRSRALEFEEALAVVAAAERRMAGREYSLVSYRVLALAQRSGCSAHDCEYVSLAEDLGTRLVTTDRQVLAAFPGTAVSPEDFVR
jgi:predicted nucleic acid-binding protein